MALGSGFSLGIDPELDETLKPLKPRSLKPLSRQKPLNHEAIALHDTFKQPGKLLRPGRVPSSAPRCRSQGCSTRTCCGELYLYRLYTCTSVIVRMYVFWGSILGCRDRLGWASKTKTGFRGLAKGRLLCRSMRRWRKCGRRGGKC